MKRYLKNFQFSQSFISECIYECLQKRWKRTDTAYFFAEYIQKFNISDKNIHKIARACRTIARNPDTRYELYEIVDYIACDMYNDIVNRKITLKPIRYEVRKDSSSRKERVIGISSIKQQVFDYIAVNTCKKMFLAKIGFYQCASLKGKGQVFGKTAIEGWIRKDRSNTKYVYKCDVKKYYPSIDHDNIKKLLARDIKNNDVLYLLGTLIDSYNEGLCIGSYLSQYLANYYLSYAYHYVTEKSFSIRNHKNGTVTRENHVSHILFYMDDIIMFSANKKYLKRAVDDFKNYLKNFLLLDIKSNDRLFKLDGDKIDMMGYIISRHHTVIRKRIFIRICRVVRRIRRKRYKITYNQAKQIVSYYGWIKHSNSYNFCKQYSIGKIMSKAKKVVSEYEKGNLQRKTA